MPYLQPQMVVCGLNIKMGSPPSRTLALRSRVPFPVFSDDVLENMERSFGSFFGSNAGCFLAPPSAYARCPPHWILLEPGYGEYHRMEHGAERAGMRLYRLPMCEQESRYLFSFLSHFGMVRYNARTYQKRVLTPYFVLRKKSRGTL